VLFRLLPRWGVLSWAYSLSLLTSCVRSALELVFSCSYPIRVPLESQSHYRLFLCLGHRKAESTGATSSPAHPPLRLQLQPRSACGKFPLRCFNFIRYSLPHGLRQSSIHVDRGIPPALVLARRKIHGPKHHGVRDEHRVVRNVPPDADPPPKAIHDMALILGIWRAQRERAGVFLEPCFTLMRGLPSHSCAQALCPLSRSRVLI
jgi:hypothetical protein